MSENNVTTTVYKSMRDCSAKENIPMSLLKMAKKMDAPGFQVNGVISFHKLSPWLALHRPQLEHDEDKNLTYYKTQIAKRDLVLRDLTIAQKKQELIDPDEIKKFLVQLGVVFSSVLKKQRTDLMSRCIGYEREIDESTGEVFKLIEEELSKWKI